MLASSYILRHATVHDVSEVELLIALSARALSVNDYNAAQIDGALSGAFGVDTQLIRDETYFVVEHEDQMVGCGGWSRRRTPFGGDARADRDESWLDPRTEGAKIRAFFVHPGFARRGVGRAILERSESEAIQAGFSSFALMATLPGVRFYEKCGYVAEAAITYGLPNGVDIRFVPMNKRVTAQGQHRLP